LATHRSVRKERLEAEIEYKETDPAERLAFLKKTLGSEFQLSATSFASQKYLGIILCTTLPPAGRGGLSEPQYRYRGALNAPIILIFITGQAQRSMLVGELSLMGLPGETMRPLVPSKGLLINLIAAWKTISRQGVGSQCYF
jgi:hypothetical protein